MSRDACGGRAQEARRCVGSSWPSCRSSANEQETVAVVAASHVSWCVCVKVSVAKRTELVCTKSDAASAKHAKSAKVALNFKINIANCSKSLRARIYSTVAIVTSKTQKLFDSQRQTDWLPVPLEVVELVMSKAKRTCAPTYTIAHSPASYKLL